MTIQDYIKETRKRQEDSRIIKPSGYKHESCVDPSVCMNREVAKLVRMVEIMSEALEICHKSTPHTDPTGIHYSTAAEALQKASEVASE